MKECLYTGRFFLACCQYMVLLAILPLIFLFLVDLMVQASCVEHA
jgi:hypothetical protein